VSIDSDEGLKGDKSVHQNTGQGESGKTLLGGREANQENAPSLLPTHSHIRREHSFGKRRPSKLRVHFRRRGQGNREVMGHKRIKTQRFFAFTIFFPSSY
jgi:hypothetical protein